MGEESKAKDEERFSVKVADGEPVAPVIDRAISNGWKSISVRGPAELCRAVWFEGTMKGIDVQGYRATELDKKLAKNMRHQGRPDGVFLVRADEVVFDYARRVIPHLEGEHETLRKKRLKLGITTTDMDRTYGLNLPTGFKREIDEKFIRVRGALVRALEEQNYFLQMGSRTLEVRQSFEDGVSRLIPAKRSHSLNSDATLGRQIKR